MKKLYFLFSLCLILLGSAEAHAAKGVIKFKSGKFVPGSGKVKAFVVDILVKAPAGQGDDDDTRAPKIGVDVTVEGGELEPARPAGVADQKMKLWVTAPEVTLHGDFADVSLTKGEITEIDISGCPGLYSIRVNENPLKRIDVSENPELRQLWVSYCPNVETIDVSKNTKLNSLSVQGCNLSRLDVGSLPELTNLNAGENPNLHEIDVTGLAKLEELWVNGNGMRSLDVSKNPELEHLECSKNNLRGLSVANNPKLVFLSVWDNGLKDADLDNLIASLVMEPGSMKREFCVYNERSKQPNICVQAQGKAVLERGWKVERAKWSNFFGQEFFVWEDYKPEDMPLGIGSAKHEPKADVWYDLRGRRLSKPAAPGIYILNGKKIVVK